MLLAAGFARAEKFDANAPYRGRLNYDVGNHEAVLEKMTEAQAFDIEAMTKCNCGLNKLDVPNPRCRQTYQKLFDKPEFNIKLVLGYVDVTPQPYSLDKIYRHALYDLMVRKPCPVGAQLCAFKQDPDDDERFTKIIRGPDGKPRTVVVTLVNSSLTGYRAKDDARGAEQEEKSEHAQNTLLDFCHSDFTMFMGHARSHCGLGTFPPFLYNIPTKMQNGETAEVAHVNYAQECKQRKTMDKISNSLQQCQPKVFSQLACRSNPNMDRLLTKYPQMITQRSKTYTWPMDWPFQVVGTLEGLLGQVCDPGTLEKMVNPPFTDPNGAMTYNNFFK